jgi:hypothetical protein
MQCEFGWVKIRADYWNRYHRLPSGNHAMAERLAHTRWYYEHMEKPDVRNAVEVAYKEHCADIKGEYDALIRVLDAEDFPGDALTAAQRYEFVRSLVYMQLCSFRLMDLYIGKSMQL